MIVFEKTEVFGWDAAIRGMRNSFNSWLRSDSGYERAFKCDPMTGINFSVGEDDLALMTKLAQSGPSHAKFLRFLNVTVDVTAPRYWWAEMDTYKVGTVRNSCSTMHTVAELPFTRNDFSYEHLNDGSLEALDSLIGVLNKSREAYNENKDKQSWWQMIQLLPASYNQKATLQLNYQVLKNIYETRKGHRLDEWHDFCVWIDSLPYSGLITGSNYVLSALTHGKFCVVNEEFREGE